MTSVVHSKWAGQQQEASVGTDSWRDPAKPILGLWRVALGALLAIVLLIGVNLYAVLQLHEVTTLSVELVSQRYPAIESAKWLITNLYTQLANEKKYLVVHDPWFLMEFRDQAEEFTQTLTVLQYQESSVEGRAILGETEQLYADYRALFRAYINQQRLAPRDTAHYEKNRDAVVARIAQQLQTYVGLHETRVSHGVPDVRLRSSQALILSQFTIMAILLASGAIGFAGFQIWRLLHRRQAPAIQACLGSVNTPADGETLSRPQADSMPAALAPRSWRPIRQEVQQIWKGAS